MAKFKVGDIVRLDEEAARRLGLLWVDKYKLRGWLDLTGPIIRKSSDELAWIVDLVPVEYPDGFYFGSYILIHENESPRDKVSRILMALT